MHQNHNFTINTTLFYGFLYFFFKVEFNALLLIWFLWNQSFIKKKPYLMAVDGFKHGSKGYEN